MTDVSPRDSPSSAAMPVRVILPILMLPVLMLAVFTISVGFGIVLPQLPALIERLLGAVSTLAEVSRISIGHHQPLRCRNAHHQS